MYNFAGLYHRIWSVSGKLLFIVAICIFFEKPWKKKFTIKKYCYELVATVLAIGYALVMLSRICFPDVMSYTGEFCYANNDSSIISYNNKYVFKNGKGEKSLFYLDDSSQKQICPDEFNEGESYRIYFDSLTKVIVKVE